MEVIETNYREVMDKPLRILEIFNDFFTEERVDMQGFPTLDEIKSMLPEKASVSSIKGLMPREGFILVHFPFVRVTNEYDKYTDIKNLYAKVTFDLGGRIQGKFLLNRSEYTMLHISNNYMHSHICDIPFFDFTKFQLPCTGSGPINNTICSLAREFDEDLWRLFCLELDRYVQTESIAGTPYHRLESLTSQSYNNRMHRCYFSMVVDLPPKASLLTQFETVLSRGRIADFAKYVIDNNILSFTYNRIKGYIPAMSTSELYIKMSNAFIKWYNEQFNIGMVSAPLRDLLSKRVLSKYTYMNGNFYTEGIRRSTAHYIDMIGSPICTFKGHDVTLVITDLPSEENTEENSQVLILSPTIVTCILSAIFNVINFEYGHTRNQDNTINQEIRFL